MRAEAKTVRLLVLLEYEERLTRWESLPSAAREEAVDRLARMMARVVEGENSNQKGNAGLGSAP